MYTEKLAEEICTCIAHSDRGLTYWCKKKNHFPSRDTIFQWILRKPDFADKYARAKEMQAEYMSDQLLEISDDGTNDTIEEQGRIKTDHDVVQRSRLRVDTRKWLLSKLIPKKYGDRIQQEVSGADNAPLIPVINLVVRKPATLDE